MYSVTKFILTAHFWCFISS